MEETGITKEFLEGVLKFPIERFQVKPGQNLGDGYTCALHSVAVYPKDGDSNDPLNIVIKCFPNNETRQQLLESSSIFEVELGMYQEVIPELRRFQEEAKIENIIEPPFPKFYFGRFLDAEARKNLGRPLQGLDNCIIMPDLRTKDNGAFRLRNRLLGLDRAHYQLTIEAHAKLHALSWAYKQITGTTLLKRFPFFDMTKVHAAWESMKDMNVMIFEEYRKMFRDEPELLEAVNFLQERYQVVLRQAGLMKKLDGEEIKWTKDNILRKPVEAVEGEEPWTVLLHGDAWSNNMMFRYDEKTDRPVEVLLVDLQMSREGDPICDLQYTIYACTSSEFRQKHLESMLHIYHDTFVDVCKRLGVPALPGFTFPEFKRRFNRGKIFGSAIAAMALLAVMKPPEEALDMEKMEDGESVEGEDAMSKAAKMFEKIMVSDGKKDPRANKPLVERMGGMLKDMVEDGVL